MIATSIDSASSGLWWSNVIYVGGAALTLAAAMIVFIEKRLIATGRRERSMLITEFVAVGAALVSLIGTTGAIHYGNLVSSLKDADLAAYKKSAQLQISQNQKDTAIANQNAHSADLEAKQTDQENVRLRLQLQSHEASEKRTDLQLAAQNKQNSDFAHALAQQQATMAEQTHVSPELTPAQVQMLANMLKPFSGQDVELHTTSDTVVERLASAIATALHAGGVTTKSFSTDLGRLYQGVSVAVHAPNDVPPIATALVVDLRQFGIDVHPVAAPKVVRPGHVGIYF